MLTKRVRKLRFEVPHRLDELAGAVARLDERVNCDEPTLNLSAQWGIWSRELVFDSDDVVRCVYARLDRRGSIKLFFDDNGPTRMEMELTDDVNEAAERIVRFMNEDT